MPTNKNRRASGKGSKSSSSSQSSTDHAFAQSAQVVGKAQVITPAADFGRRAPSWMLTQTPPRQIRNQIIWVQGKYQLTQTISNTVPTERNFTFQFTDLPDLVGLASYFDQYCIYSTVVNLTPDFEGAGSTLYSFGSVVTAIDYDSTSALGAFAQVESYNSAVIAELNTGQSLQRYIKPCVAPALYNTASAFSGYGIQRLWVDSASTGVPHYGFRSIFISNTVSGLSVTFDCNMIVGLRNNY